MIPSKLFLELSQNLRRAGVDPRMEPGYLLGRGFADLGFEVFAVLPGDKLLSLFTAQLSTLQKQDLEHLFWLPDCDQLIELADSLGFDLQRSEYKQQRSWQIEFKRISDGRSFIAEEQNLNCALARGLLKGLTQNDL